MPDPLVAAAEALLDVEDSIWPTQDIYEGERSAAVAALRAALAAQRQRDERAEAAVAYATADFAFTDAISRLGEARATGTGAACIMATDAAEQARHVRELARRRWAEVEGRGT